MADRRAAADRHPSGAVLAQLILEQCRNGPGELTGSIFYASGGAVLFFERGRSGFGGWQENGVLRLGFKLDAVQSGRQIDAEIATAEYGDAPVQFFLGNIGLRSGGALFFARSSGWEVRRAGWSASPMILRFPRTAARGG
jgi:hypothetical protein